METIKVTFKSEFGRERFYPNNNSAELVLKLMKQASFTRDQLKVLKTLGFTVMVETKSVDLDEGEK